MYGGPAPTGPVIQATVIGKIVTLRTKGASTTYAPNFEIEPQPGHTVTIAQSSRY